MRNFEYIFFVLLIFYLQAAYDFRLFSLTFYKKKFIGKSIKANLPSSDKRSFNDVRQLKLCHFIKVAGEEQKLNVLI